MPERPSVLFICVKNAGRPQMAAGQMRQVAGDAIEIYSARHIRDDLHGCEVSTGA